jgi:allantoate deiminase
LKRAFAGNRDFPVTNDTSLAAARKAIDRCESLARFTETPGSIQRTFLSAPVRDCHREIAGWMEALGAKVNIDAAGNLRSVFPSAQAEMPRVLIGSHLDTVPDAGAYDGALGVVLAVALIEELKGKRLPFAIEVVGFSDEEGVRFSTPFIGSRALVGGLDGELLRRTDAHSITVRKAIEDFRLRPDDIAAASLDDNALCYLEFHIEQGPVLEKMGRPLAAVDAIAGQSRLEIVFLGVANHAGTTPMDLRRDSLAAAAEWIVAVEREARAMDGLVATVGAIQAKPGATNVIAGETRLSLDVRHASDDTRLRAVDSLLRIATETTARRGLDFRVGVRMNQSAVPMDSFLVGQIEEAIAEAGCAPHRMASGAGHDAMILAARIPAAMIFLRSPGGISHNRAEAVELADVAKAIETGLRLLDRLASSSDFLRRIRRA